METIRIVPYNPEFQPAIDKMMEGIAAEFSESISSPQSTKLYEAYLLPDQWFWVALAGGEIAGTIGIVLFANGNAVIKRMMVDSKFRGSSYNTSKKLLEQSFEFAKKNNVNTIYLGTMEQFKAAQRFYEKNGFNAIGKPDLPQDYDPNPIDTLYYRYRM